MKPKDTKSCIFKSDLKLLGVSDLKYHLKMPKTIYMRKKFPDITGKKFLLMRVIIHRERLLRGAVEQPSLRRPNLPLKVALL